MEIVIMRGLPGCGKTTRIKEFIDNSRVTNMDTLVVSADYHHTKDGVYCYIKENVATAHSLCFASYVKHVYEDRLKPNITLFVDNTNTTLVELAPYVRVAEVFEVKYKILYFLIDVWTAASRNTHKVPINTLLAMEKSLITDIVPAHWNQEVVLV